MAVGPLGAVAEFAGAASGLIEWFVVRLSRNRKANSENPGKKRAPCRMGPPQGAKAITGNAHQALGAVLESPEKQKPLQTDSSARASNPAAAAESKSTATDPSRRP